MSIPNRHLLLSTLVAASLSWAGAASAQLQPGSVPTSMPTSMPTSLPTATGFDHAPWNTIVSTYVADGVVNYSGLMANGAHMALLDGYVLTLATAGVAELSRDDRLAFLINAYNALVVKTVLDNWPVAGPLEINGFFDRMSFRVAGEEMTLNGLEEHKIREVFDEPRIHFACNCAAVGCPPLRSEAYIGARISDQLEEQTTNFIRANTRFDVEGRGIHVTRIFEWYLSDFSMHGGTRGFTSRYVHEADVGFVRATTNFIRFDDYDWTINGH